MKIYVATSWKNVEQPYMVEVLRAEGHEVYDFRNPAEGNAGFSWSKCGVSDYKGGPTTPDTYRRLLGTKAAAEGYQYDINALRACDCCLLMLPSGRSASWEFGYALGLGKKTIVYMPGCEEPELMYRESLILSVISEVVDALRNDVKKNCVQCAYSYLPPDENVTCGHPLAGSFGTYVARGPIPECGPERALFQLHPGRKDWKGY